MAAKGCQCVAFQQRTHPSKSRKITFHLTMVSFSRPWCLAILLCTRTENDGVRCSLSVTRVDLFLVSVCHAPGVLFLQVSRERAALQHKRPHIVLHILGNLQNGWRVSVGDLFSGRLDSPSLTKIQARLHISLFSFHQVHPRMTSGDQ